MNNPSIFKAYDIRGVHGVDFDDAFAYDLGLAYCQLRREELGRNEFTIVVGRDMRLSSPVLHSELIRGLRAGGADAIDIGLASTPTFYFAVAHFKYDGGIQVSASHNPKEWNGFKLVRNMALPIGETSGIQDLRRLIEEGVSPHEREGSLSSRADVLVEQIRHDLSFIDTDSIKPMKIVIDTANAMGAPYFDELCTYLPQLSVERMNWELDGTFPAHEADPYKKENVAALCERVKAGGADLGIATDGDSDRIFFIDNDGTPLEPGITRAILCKIFLRQEPNATIAYDIRPGKITYDTIVENGGKQLVTRVGHSLIKEAAIDAGAYFAGESSGHFFLNMENEGCYEVPGIVALKLLAEISQSGLSLAEYARPFEKYFHSGEINTKVADPDAVIQAIKDTYADGNQNTLDGLTVEYPDFWFNVRKSNTEPLLRLNLEAAASNIMKEKTEEVLKLIRS